ncbi:MAG: UDP-N-acetylenolpyruvoylglucosamine reductase [Flammeovirgaceae bacterium]|nr:UDP-N-acetylenolpyruvoylglucosamine reductase [Flammeovirgaceae bacterium]|tara:strand:+ start:646 stop:1650 length:1005 start_codon:yes stop_codon:yes gene_type:complete
MLEKENISLENMNSFRVVHKAKRLLVINNPLDLTKFLNTNNIKRNEIQILGEGSNTLFTKDYEGIILHSQIKGIEIKKEDNDSVILRVGSGENWDEFVDYCVKSNYFGIENLSLIPGSVGAAPIQNIGAYGVEIKDYVVSVTGIDLYSNELVEYSNEECEFKYRDSLFKNRLKNRLFITSVEFKLYKNSKFNLSYKDLEVLDKSKLTISKLREEIIKIRSSKLPDPSSKGNAGSFFKNPEIDELKLNELISNNVDFKYFEIPGNMYKIPAAWLIEKAGWKGYNDGLVGVYEKHALVLINHSSKSGKNIKKLSKSIKEDVFKKFGIMLNEEVNIV